MTDGFLYVSVRGIPNLGRREDLLLQSTRCTLVVVFNKSGSCSLHSLCPIYASFGVGTPDC